jgi:hypothetical protein
VGDSRARLASPGPPVRHARLAALLGQPTGGPSHVAAITGPAAAAGEAAGTVTVTVPTTAGAAVITVVRSDGRWLAAAARYAPSGR